MVASLRGHEDATRNQTALGPYAGRIGPVTKVDEALTLLSDWVRAAGGKDPVVDEMLVSLAATRREE